MISYEKVTGAFDLTRKTAVITEGAGGIGEATAMQLHTQNASLLRYFRKKGY